MAKKPAKAAKKAAKKTGTAVAVHKAAPPAPPQNFYAMLHSLATDPRVNVANVQAILDMKRTEEDREAKRAFDVAMAQMQPRLPVIKKTGEIVIHDKDDKRKIIQRTPYAKWEVIHKIITPILAAHGFALTFRTGRTPEGLNTVTAVLSHSGHREETTSTLHTDASGSKNNVQGVGSAYSYGKRYAAAAILNLNFEGEDDDGNKAGDDKKPAGQETVTDEQVKTIQSLMKATDSPASRVLSYAGDLAVARKLPIREFTTVQDIPAVLAPQIIAAMEQAKANLKK